MKMPGLVLLAAILILGPSAHGGDPRSPGSPMEEVVDSYIDEGLSKAGVHAASEADDATIVRRITLDLVGRIPTPAETRGYLESTDPDKKAHLVDRLMDSPGFIRRQAEALDAMLMAGVKGSLQPYLSKALAAKRPWDQVFREILSGDESQPDREGVAEFLKSRAKDLDRLTSDTSSVFFGVNVSCAKCHDHPRVPDWKQDHYFGLKSFLNRTFENGNFIGEHDYGRVKFLTTDGKEKKAAFMFLTGRIVEIPGGDEPSGELKKEEKKLLAEAKSKKLPPPAPKFSARSRLAEIALEPGEREFFARSIVNRLWNQYFGRGLVMPLDQMHSANPASHPELLDWLARDTVEHGYDLRRLIRGFILTRAYARTSRWESGEAPEPKLFAFAAVRPLSPNQLATSMWVATADPTIPSDDAKMESLANQAKDLSRAIARPGEDYQIGASEALLMSNGDRLNALLSEGDNRLVGRLIKLTDRRERVETAVRSILSRPPDEDEYALLGDFLSAREDRPAEGCRQLVWALLNDAEFRFNY